MPDTIKKEELSFDDSVKVNNRGQVILGKLRGPCADFVHPTRNGRQYDEALWEKVFDDPIVNEFIESGGIPGELDHPADRIETDSSKIAIMMPEKPKKDKDGHLIATFDILDTPNGRIVYTLAKYGYKLGISSRGDGHTYDDDYGNEHVDEDSYVFKAFDVVLLPAVKSARMEYITESLNSDKAKFNKALTEAFERSTADERAIMTETLSNLNIAYTPEQDDESKNGDNIDAKPVNESVGHSEDEIIEELQEALKVTKALQAQVTQLNEQLSGSYAADAKKDEQIASYKKSIATLTEQLRIAKANEAKVHMLRKELENKSAEVNRQRTLTESLNASRSSLNEQLQAKTAKIKELESKVNKLEEQVSNDIISHKKQIINLNEQIAGAEKDSAIKQREYATKLAKAKALVEKYKQVAQTAVDKYIASQAVRLGVSVQEIKNRLDENYSFNDIDSVCESLQTYKVNMSMLPFNLTSKPKVKVTESKPITPINSDDEVDDQLLSIIGMN